MSVNKLYRSARILFLSVIFSLSSHSIAADYGIRFHHDKDSIEQALSLDLLNSSGEFLMKFNLDIGSLSESERMMLIKSQESGRTQYRYFDLKMQIMLPGNYEGGKTFSEGLAAVYQNGLWGFINRQGEWVIPPRYHHVESFRDGVSQVKYKNLDNEIWIEHIDTLGQLLPISEHNNVGQFREGLAPRNNHRNIGYVDEELKPLFPVKFSEASPFTSFGLAEASPQMDSLSRKEFMARMPSAEQAKFIGRTYPNPPPLVTNSEPEGIIDRQGNWVFPPQSQDVRILASDRFVIRDDQGNKRLVNRDGQTLIPSHKNNLIPFGHHIYTPNYSHQWGFIDFDGKWVIKAQFQEVDSFSEGLAAAKKDGKWGYINKEGEWNITPQFIDVRSFSEGIAAVLGDDGRWAFITKSGESLSPLHFKSVKSFSNGIAAVKVDSKWGYLRRSGDWLVKPTFKAADTFKDTGYGLVRQGELYRFVNTNGEMNELFEYEQMNEYLPNSNQITHEETTALSKSGVWGIVDQNEKIIVPFMFTKARPFYNGMAAVKFGDNWHYTNGIDMLSTPYAYASDYTKEGVAVVVPQNNPFVLHYIDRMGAVILRRKRSIKSKYFGLFSSESNYVEGKLAEEINDTFYGLSGFRDTSGEWAIPPRFESAHPFSEGLAAVRMGEQGKLYDRGGKLLVANMEHAYRSIGESDYLLDSTTSVESVRYIYRDPDGYRYITDGMANTISSRFEIIGKFRGRDYATASQGGKIGLINRDGKWLITPRYQQAKLFERQWRCDEPNTELVEDCYQNSPLLIVQSDDGYGYVDLNGQWLSPPRSDASLIKELDGTLVFQLGYDKYATVTREGKWIQDSKQEMAVFIESQFAEPEDFLTSKRTLLSNGLSISPYENGIAMAYQDEGWDYVNTKGGTAITDRFDDAKPFSEGLAAVRINKKWGYINRKGRVVIQPQYKKAEPFRGGGAVVQSSDSNEYGIIDSEGNIVLAMIYSAIKSYENGYSVVNGSVVKGTEDVSFLVNPAGEPVGTEYRYIEPYLKNYPGMMRVINQNRKDQLLTHAGEIRSPIADSIEILPLPYAMLIDQGKDIDRSTITLKLWNIESQKIEWADGIQIPNK